MNENETISKEEYMMLPFYNENKMSEWKEGDMFRVVDEIKPSDKKVTIIKVLELIPTENSYKLRMLKKDLEVEK